MKKIFTNATVVTMDPANPLATAVTVEDGRITAVGSAADLAGGDNPAADVVDLGGATLLPGFIDAHAHPAMDMTIVGPGVVDIRPTVCTSAEAVMDRLRTAAASAKPGEWVTAYGWDSLLLRDLPEMSGALLTEISPDNPVSVVHNSGHSSWTNRRGLELLGITRDTPNEGHSEYERDADGNPTGRGFEMPAVWILGGPPMMSEPEDFPRLMTHEMDYLNAQGVTTVGDLALGEALFERYQELAKSGSATVRVRAYETSGPAGRSKRAVGEGDEMFRQIGIKVWSDGSPWVGNIDTSFAYQDSDSTHAIGLEPGHRGHANYTKEQLLEVCRSYYPDGWQIACHSHGDNAIDMVLDVYEEIQREHPRPDARLRIEHCGSMTGEQYRRATELGVTCSLFVDHIYYWGEVLDEFFGDRGHSWTSARAALDAGQRISFHNDGPVTPIEPLRNIQVAVTRTSRRGRTFGPEHRVTVQEALRAVTIDAAWQLFSEHEVGSIEVGKFADFVVLAENPLDVEPMRIGDIAVLGTYLAGQRVGV
ncbi:amidohydrolase [Rhodococcus spelaei]|uniref:Amidohydrolase n=1 Tax=Rhodococcus spelaei TaxID=2546320 RepID=A0A541BNW2_9NOCA|nr:amidohydrolase [Rhodococcus spelaei]TQF74002.1 amidohydrolase [Rhodococcus spelaei]